MSKTQLFKVYEPRKTFIDALLELLSYSSAGFIETINTLSSIQKFCDIRPWNT
ncbi:hypothetical protein BG015_005895, partial [Linnemannia schmuckeri]